MKRIIVSMAFGGMVVTLIFAAFVSHEGGISPLSREGKFPWLALKVYFGDLDRCDVAPRSEIVQEHFRRRLLIAASPNDTRKL